MSEEVQTAETPETTSLSLLAHQHFGSQYKGEVREERKEETSEQETEQEEEVTQEEPEPEEGEEVEQPEAEVEKAETEGDDEGQPIASFDELIEHYDLDPEWADTLKVRGKVDGETVEYTLKDLKDNAQKNAAADKRLEEAKAKREQLNQELSQKSEALQAEYATAANLIQKAEEFLNQDSKNIDWKDLRENDPAEYSAKKSEIQERRDQIEQMKREAREQYQNSVSQIQETTETQRREILQKEQQALLEKLPEWKDDDKAKAEKSKLTGYLKNEGFDDNEIAAAADHRLIVMARKAMLYDEGQKKVDTAKKKVAKVPKVVKPGATKSASQSKQERLNKLKAKFRKTGKIEDAQAVLRAEKE